MAWLTGWTYRKPITLSRASGAVTLYQMKLLVGESAGATGEDVDCNSHVKTDFSDLRFTAADGTTLLDYWIESTTGTTPNQLATVWIEFGSIGTGATTFYMYYGKADATAYSNGANTFLFFDHFLGSSLGAQWNLQGTPTVGSSIVTLDSGFPTWDAIKAASYNVLYARIRSRFALSAFNNHAVGMSNSLMTQQPYVDDSAYFLGVSASNIYCISSNEGVITQSGYGTGYGAGTYVIGEILWQSGTAKYYINDSLKGNYTTNIANENLAPRADGSHATEQGSIALDWIFVSQFLITEPAWGSWGSEETSSYSGSISVALAPESTYLYSPPGQEYLGDIAFAMSPASSWFADYPNYSGAITTSLTPGSSYVPQWTFSGAINLSLIAGATYGPGWALTGAIAVALNPGSTFFADYVRLGAISASLTPSCVKFYDAPPYAGAITAIITPTAIYTYDHPAYTGAILVLLLPGSTSLANYVFSGALLFDLIPTPTYQFDEGGFSWNGNVFISLLPSSSYAPAFAFLGGIDISLNPLADYLYEHELIFIYNGQVITSLLVSAETELWSPILVPAFSIYGYEKIGEKTFPAPDGIYASEIEVEKTFPIPDGIYPFKPEMLN